jgi:hypothetical protein
MTINLSQQMRESAMGPPVLGPAPTGSFFPGDNPIWSINFALNEDFLAFQGHFEGHPVLPALAQVLLAKITAELLLNRSCFLKKVVSAKFMSLVEPGTELSVLTVPPKPPGPGEWRFQLIRKDCPEGFSEISRLKLFLEGF